MEGNMRGPSSQDCEKSFVRTGVVTAGMKAKAGRTIAGLVQISGVSVGGADYGAQAAAV
jgi:hypothetical protein